MRVVGGAEAAEQGPELVAALDGRRDPVDRVGHGVARLGGPVGEELLDVAGVQRDGGGAPGRLVAGAGGGSGREVAVAGGHVVLRGSIGWACRVRRCPLRRPRTSGESLSLEPPGAMLARWTWWAGSVRRRSSPPRWTPSRRANAGCWCVRGEAGIGKTRLLQDAGRAGDVASVRGAHRPGHRARVRHPAGGVPRGDARPRAGQPGGPGGAVAAVPRCGRVVVGRRSAASSCWTTPTGPTRSPGSSSSHWSGDRRAAPTCWWWPRDPGPWPTRCWVRRARLPGRLTLLDLSSAGPRRGRPADRRRPPGRGPRAGSSRARAATPCCWRSWRRADAGAVPSGVVAAVSARAGRPWRRRARAGPGGIGARRPVRLRPRCRHGRARLRRPARPRSTSSWRAGWCVRPGSSSSPSGTR